MKKRIVILLAVFVCLFACVFAVSISAENEPALEIKAYNLSYGNSVYVSYAINCENIPEGAKVQLLVWDKPQEEYIKGTELASSYTNGTTAKVGGVEYPVFVFNKIIARQMAVDFYAVAYVKTADGEYYSAPTKYSVLQYVYNKLGYTGTASTDEVYKALLRETLEYGAAAQRYFAKEDTRLADAQFYQVVVNGGILPDGFNKGLYLEGETVTLSAPAVDEGGATFSHWADSDEKTVSTERSFEITVGTKHETYTAVYENQNVSCTHTDQNNDGTCDNCDISVIVIIDFYTINDIHGKMFDSKTQPGVDELTTYLEDAKAGDEYAIVLANGDMWQGSSESNLTRGKMMTEWLNNIGTVSMTLGNHEFDWANDYIYSNRDIANFPLLAINIYETETNERVDFAEPSVIVECGGAKVGIIGAIGDCHSSISQDKVLGIEFKVGSELSNLVKSESEKLRAAGCDYIIFAVHDGVNYYGSGSANDADMANFYDVALSDGYIDLVFESHTHCEYILQDSNGVYHIQAGGDNTAISHVEIELNYANDSSIVNTIETVSSDIYDDSMPDTILEELKEKYKDEIAKGDEELGNISRDVSGDELRQLCADLYLEKGLEKWGEKYNVVLGGGYISVRDPKVLYQGIALYKDIYSLFPFDNGLYLCSISGLNLKERFIYSTNSNYFISVSDYGNSLSINDAETYYIITDAYSAFYSDNGLTIVEEYGEEKFARDFIAEHIKNGGYSSDDSEVITLTSIPNIINKVNELGVNVETSEDYYVLGTIITEPQSMYGNCTIRDVYGNTIYVYGLYGEDGTRYDGLVEKPGLGDTIIVKSIALLYAKNSESEPYPELKNARIVCFYDTTDIGEVLSLGEALEDNASTYEYYTVIGQIKETPNATYGNTTIVDADGNEIYIYGIYDESGNVRYDSLGITMKIGDILIVQGRIKKYVKNGEAPLIEIEKGHLVLIILT